MLDFGWFDVSMEVSGSPEKGEDLPVQVMVRLRPLKENRESVVVHVGPRSIKIDNPVQTTSANGESVRVSKHVEATFDNIFAESSTQMDVFLKTCPSMLKHFFNGGNALLFCYGPSGSGKSHTVFGDDKNPGLVPNVLTSLFNSIETANSGKTVGGVASSKAVKSGVPTIPLIPGMEYSVFLQY